MRQTKPLSIDTILLLVLVMPHLMGVNTAVGALLLVTVGSYVLLDTLSRSTTFSPSPDTLFTLKLTLIMLITSLVVVLPMVAGMIMREATAPGRHIHDGAIQTEESIKYLLEGKNPYTEDYFGTPLEEWEFALPESQINPALYHNAYLPFTFVFSLPFYVVSTSLTAWYDQRLVYLLLFFCTLWPLMKHTVVLTRKLSLLMIFSLNFFTAFYLSWGVNDSFVMFWLIISSYLLQRDKTTLSALSLGLACASKQTAWLFVPFFLAYLWISAPSPRKWACLRGSYPLLVVPALVILPFLLWDPAAFVDDTYLYLSGQAISSYPIRGFGFGGLMLAIGLIPDASMYFPFILFQAASCAPLLVILLKGQLSDNTVRRCWLGYGLLLFAFTFFSRFFNENYLGIIVNALALGSFSGDGKIQSQT